MGRSFIPDSNSSFGGMEKYPNQIHNTEGSSQSSLMKDLKLLEAETRASIKRSKAGVVRDVQNLTDEEILKVAKLQQKMDEAAQVDINVICFPGRKNTKANVFWEMMYNFV